MMNSLFAGTFALTKLAIRRDRIRLTLWVLGITILVASITATFSGIFATQEELVNVIKTLSGSPAMRAFLAPASGASLGGFIMVRTSTLIVVLFSLLSMQTVVRHTRGNEETGRSEMIGSTVVGRYASLTSVLIVVVSLNFLLSILTGLAFIINGLDFAGSMAAGFSFGAVGLFFGGIGAITSQLSESGRGANGLSGVVLGVAFLLSSIGNILGDVKESGVEVISAWPAWLSPLGWYQQIHAFHQNNWWVLILFIAFFLLSVSIAFTLNNKRDLGAGLIPPGRGPEFASKRLLSPLGLAFRLQRNLFLGWAIPMLIFGAVFGAISSEFNQAISSVEGSERIFGDNLNMNETFLAAIIGIIGSFVIFYMVQSLMRMGTEESNGYLEPVLSTSVSRASWMLSHIFWSFLGAMSLLVILGLSAGLTASVEAGVSVLTILEASILQGPAILSVAGVVILALGFLPSWSSSMSWFVLGISIIAGPFLGPLLDLPTWVQNISPFTHLPEVTGDFTALPIAILLGLCILLTVIGVRGFQQRSLSI